MATEKTSDIFPHEGLSVSAALVQTWPGLRFDVTHCGRTIGWLRVEDFGDGFGPGITGSEIRSRPYEGVDWNALERLAVDELVRMQTPIRMPDGKKRRHPEHAITDALGFGQVPRSGAGRQGRPRVTLSLWAVRVRAAVAAEWRTGADLNTLEQGRKRGLVAGGQLTAKARAILSRVDGAKVALVALVARRGPGPVEREDYARELIPPFRQAEIDAAIVQLVHDGHIDAAPASPDVRRLSGALFQRISSR